jgi:hypothetical protein
MKTTFSEKIIYTLGVLAMIALAPILLVCAVVKTIFTFLVGGFRAIKDE